MPFYRLKPGAQCGFCGRDLNPGEVIELSERIAAEVTDKLEEVESASGMTVVKPPAPTFVRLSHASGQVDA